jgi:excisionase family DNA binding protein
VKQPTQAAAATSVLAPRLLPIKAAAAYLSCTVWAVRSLAWNRQVPSLKLGNRILFDKKDLDAYVDAQKTAVAQ